MSFTFLQQISKFNGQCRLCSRLYVKNENDFVSSIKYHFTLIFTNNKILGKEVELLFVNSRRMRFSLDVPYCLKLVFSWLILNRIVT